MRIIIFISLLILPSLCFAADSAVFIMYHRFGEAKYPLTNIRMQQFKAQMKLLKYDGYHILPVPEIITKLKEHQVLPNKTVGILIDDAYQSVYTRAWPILKKYHFPFTLFVATYPIDQHYKNMMTWQQIRTLAANGVTIGNHSNMHGHMVNMNSEKAYLDIKNAQQRIFKETGVIPTLFAYPYGEYDLRLKNIVKHMGFNAAFMQVSGAAGYTTDVYALPRFALNEYYGGLERFKMITQTLAMSIKDLHPASPVLQKNPPKVSFIIVKPQIGINKLRCFASLQGRAKVSILPAGHIIVQPYQAFTKGRDRINCTIPAGDGRFYWLGLFYFVN